MKTFMKSLLIISRDDTLKHFKMQTLDFAVHDTNVSDMIYFHTKNPSVLRRIFTSILLIICRFYTASETYVKD